MQHLYSFAKSFLGLACLVLFLSTCAAVAQTTTAGGIGLFGDGSDKDVTIDVATTLDRDMYYRDLRIKTGQTLDTGGFRVFVSGTLTLDIDARISRDGNAPLGIYGGPALSRGTLGGSGTGGDPFQPKGISVANSLGGSGGGGLYGYAGVASPPDASAGGGGVFRSALQALSGRSLDGAFVNGGGGGGGFLYGGGSGGGVVVVAARTVVVNDDGATISANGGQSAGGCGGGGGVVVVITTTAPPAGLKLSASGGDGSAGLKGSKGAAGFTAWLN